jgi:hypothetical protein
MSTQRSHGKAICDLTPSARGCEECLKTGSKWVHLRHLYWAPELLHEPGSTDPQIGGSIPLT